MTGTPFDNPPPMTLRSSPRARPLNDSTKGFSQGLPGSM